MANSHVHLISKQDVFHHLTIPAPPSSQLPQLPDGSIRVRSSLLSITANNMAYAVLGTPLGWWNAYPVPATLPAPYGDREKWGIVASWGFARVVESKDEAVAEGVLLWGFWPTSSLPVDLKLVAKASSSTGVHFDEVSKHRKGLMPLYNYYQVVKDEPSEEVQAWSSSTMATWLAGYFLNRYGFTAPNSGDPRLNPAGQGEWGEEDADLTSAVVVSLASSTKTARGFVWNLSRRQDNVPLALLEVTTSPSSLPTLKTNIETNKTSYGNLSKQATIDWITKFKPSRLVLVSFGAPAETIEHFKTTIMASEAAPAKLTHVALASMPSDQADPRITEIFMNTSGVIEAAFDAQGVDAVVNERYEAFSQWLEEKAMGGMELKWGSGIEGANGIEGAWESLATGALPRQKALVFKI